MNDKDKIKYILAPYVCVGYNKDSLKLGFGSIQQEIKGKHLQEALINILEKLCTPHDLHSIRSLCISDDSLSSSEGNNIYNILISGNFLIEENKYNREDRYSRHTLFYNLSGAKDTNIQDILHNKTVIILGCGGIGNLVSINLATAGVGNIILVDDDNIELSNLTRQIMFEENDVNKLKTEVLENAIRRRASNVNVTSINIKLDDAAKFSALPKADLIVVSGDSKNICLNTNSYCFQNNVPFINVGYIQDIAIWGPLIIPQTTPCYECFAKNNISDSSLLREEYEIKRKIINAKTRYQAPSIGPVNMLSSGHASLDILKYLGGFGKVHALEGRVGIWTHDLRIQIQSYQRDSSCKMCNTN